MVRFFAALLFVAVAISTSEADSNHQEQAFLTCGHHLSNAQCDAFATAALGGPSTAGVVTEAAKPIGCFKDSAANTYHFNNEPTAANVPCDATNICICDKLVGAFDTSTVTCNSLGFDPIFTYDPAGQTQDVQVDIVIGSAVTGSTDPDDTCKSSKTTTDGSNTETLKGDFDAGFTSEITYGTVAAPKCGGVLDHFVDTADSNKKKIRYSVTAEATVTRSFRTGIVQRKRKFVFSLECLMEREITKTSDQGYTVLAALITANEVDAATNNFAFSATLKFYEDDTYTTAHVAPLGPANNQKVYAQIEKGADQTLFIYSVETCYATIANDPAVATAGHKDIFFTSQCPVDETMDFSVSGTNFRFDIQAFSFTTGTQATDVVFLHCDIKVCLADAGALAADCAQNGVSDCTDPILNNRRRRDVSYKSLSNGGYREETVSSSQPILLEGSQFHAPQCGEGFVYDRVAKECSRSNLIEIKGIRLASDVFKADFYNTSSKAFKDMAKEKEYLLWVLIKATGQDKTIRGVQVIGAQPGSVILDVAVKYADTVTPEQAFTTFKQLLKAPASTTRVQNVLQITQEKTIEYVPFVRQGEKADTEKLILIVVVVVLFVVVFIAGVTLFKVKQVRQQASNTRPAAGFENKGVDA